MNLSAHLASHFRDMHFGGNWTDSNLKDNLSDVTWQQATTQVYYFNTIAALVYHINYFVSALLDVLQGKPLTAHDKYSFNCPPIQSKEDWERLLNKTYADAELCIRLIAQLPESKLWENFTEEKYGTYYRNIHGIVEHSHYHLGQIVIIKKMLLIVDKFV